MQGLDLPISLCSELNRIMATFLWGKGDDQKGINWVAWENIAKPKAEGGLGVRCCKRLNQTYKMKLWWRVMAEPNNLAVKILKDKYFKPVSGKAFSTGSHIWRGMGKVWDTFSKSVQWGIGKGDTVSFWWDNWLGVGPLRNLIHGPLGHLENDLTVADMLENGV